MKKINDPKKVYRVLKSCRLKKKSIGFVPTMGALHEGHLSLVRKARKQCDIVVVSIFVNPAQFGPREDLVKYPRPLRSDLAKLKKEKIDFAFTPSVKALYPDGYATFVEVTADPGTKIMTQSLCGPFRPGHFRGVATVVAKLFQIIRPDHVYFGAKDYQQAVVVERLIRDLHFPVDLHVEPTVREEDGLAMSSRNRYLSVSERRRARILSRTLYWLRDEIKQGRRNIVSLRRKAERTLKTGLSRLDYLEFVDPSTLRPLSKYQRSMVVAVAGYVGKTRLIDNVIIKN